MVADWIGNGSVMPLRSSAATMSEGTPREANEGGEGGMRVLSCDSGGHGNVPGGVACRRISAPGHAQDSASDAPTRSLHLVATHSSLNRGEWVAATPALLCPEGRPSW